MKQLILSMPADLKLLFVQEFWETSLLDKCCGDIPVTCKDPFETEPILSVFEDIPFEHFNASHYIGADVCSSQSCFALVFAFFSPQDRV